MSGYNVNHSENMWLLSGGQLVDVSAASISYVTTPFQGRLVDAWATISAAVSGLDCTVTIKKIVASVTTTTLGTITLAVTGSAIGQTVQAVLTGSEIDCTFKAGDTLVFDSDGASSTTSIANFLGVFRGE